MKRMGLRWTLLILGLCAWGSGLAAPAALLAEESPLPIAPPDTMAAGAELKVVFEDNTFHEGPMWDPATGKLYFCAFYGGKPPRVLRLDAPGKVTTWLTDEAGIGGTFLAPDGRMLATMAYSHQVISAVVGEKGPEEIKVLAADKSWHQPNDLCQTPNGNIYFTDPDFKNKKSSAVYLLKPDGTVKKIITDMAITNGIIATLDGGTLIVADSHRKHWRAYPILEDGTTGEGRIFFAPEVPEKERTDPDGMSIDAKGNIYCTGCGGVWVVTPDGKPLGRIKTPVFVANCTFGDEDGKTLYMTGSKQVLSLRMNVPGAHFRQQP